MKNKFGFLCVLLLLTACASSDNLADAPAEDLYNQAFDDLQATRYKKAAEGFERVETEHPYSKWAVKSKLMEAYAYYKDEKYDDAILVLDRFLKYHPGNQYADYAYYMKGICYYDQIAAADKDQGNTANAEAVFRRLIALYPDSKYAEDARNKIKLTEDYRAGQEMVIGRYYLTEGNYLSALNRFNVVLEEYQTTIQIEEALYREVEIYAILGLNKYANGYYKILKENYPNGEWTAKAAKVMQKIGTENTKSTTGVADFIKEKAVTEDKPKTEETKKESKSWFSWLGFGGSDEKAAEKAVTEDKPRTEEAKKESKSWFSWLGFGGSDDKATEKAVNESKPATEEAKKEEQTLWSKLGFGGSDDKAAETADKEVVKSEKIAAKEEVTSSVTPTVKKDVGDIISAEKKGVK